MSISYPLARPGMRRLLAPVLALLLAACGGGSSSDSPAPAVASASTPATAPVTAPVMSVRGHANYAASGGSSATSNYQAALDSYNQQGEALHGKP